VDAEEPVTILTEDESWHYLGSAALGRLVTTFAGEPEIFPVNYVVQERTVLFRTAEGTKLFSAVASNTVVFEADDHDVSQGWSVIVRGRAKMLRTAPDVAKAERAQLIPWTGMPKIHYVRLTPSEITGRQFRFGPEPDPNAGFA
jgi:uncharacterized protein